MNIEASHDYESSLYYYSLRTDFLIMSGRIDGAISDCSAIIDLNPSLHSIRRKRARLFYQKQQFNFALQDVVILSDLPDETVYIDDLLLFVDISSKFNRLNDIKSALERILKIQPNHTIALLNLARLSKDTDPVYAIRLLEDYMRYHPDNISKKILYFYIELCTTNNLIDKVEKIYYSHKSKSSMDVLYQLFVFFKLQELRHLDIDSNTDQLEIQLADDIQDKDVLQKLFLLYYNGKDFSKLRALLTRYKFKNDPSKELGALLQPTIHSNEFFNTGESYFIISEMFAYYKDWVSAFYYYIQATQLKNENDIIEELIQFSHDQESEEMEVVLNAFLTQYPNNAAVNFILGELAFKRMEFMRAHELFQHALRNKFSKSERVKLNLIKVSYALHENYDDIVRDLRILIGQYPQYYLSQYYLAYIYIENDDKGYFRISEQYLKNSLSKEPKNPFFLNAMGLLKYKQGNYKLALSDFKTAYNIKKNIPILLNLGNSYMKLGKLENAFNIFKEASYIDSDSIIIQKKLTYFNERMNFNPHFKSLMDDFQTIYDNILNFSGVVFFTLNQDNVMKFNFYYSNDGEHYSTVSLQLLDASDISSIELQDRLFFYKSSSAYHSLEQISRIADDKSFFYIQDYNVCADFIVANIYLLSRGGLLQEFMTSKADFSKGKLKINMDQKGGSDDILTIHQVDDANKVRDVFISFSRDRLSVYEVQLKKIAFQVLEFENVQDLNFPTQILFQIEDQNDIQIEFKDLNVGFIQ